MEEPKILQVTYGAFSCTLEGFEDPVETLMAVAEYFRGLAADDPGFAGVGGLPDAAEMERQMRAAGAGAVEVRVEAAPAGLPDAGAAGPSFGPGFAAAPEAPLPETPRLAEQTAPADERPVGGGAGPAMASAPEEMLRSGDHDAGGARLASVPDALLKARPAEEREPESPDEEGLDVEAGHVEASVMASDSRTEDSGFRTPDVIPAAERVPDQDGTPGEAEAAADASASGMAKGAKRLLATSPDEEALLRILSRAESQLSDPEAARRRESLAHVKAAIAATQAGRAMGDVAPVAEDPTPFREDLDAVKPPPSEERPVVRPLRLVASQRVDLPRMKAALAGPQPAGLRDRTAEDPAPPVDRIAAEPPRPREATPSGDSFADFAATTGAATFPDLLEAAAVWLAREGGEGGTCRNRLLELAGGVLGREPSREEALRVFGTLLREGRLARAGNGRFGPGPMSRLGPDRLAG